MSKRELWEIVRADELKVGDVVFSEYYMQGVTLERHEDGDPPWLWQANEGESWGFDNGPIFRRIPDADDPRVLMRALEMAVNEIEARDRYGTSPNPKEKDFIDQARREFESEASDE